VREEGDGARDSRDRHRPQRVAQVEPRRVARDARNADAAAEACLVDGFRLGPLAPEHTAVVDGDTKSAAIAAASIVAR
jgi:Ribonuclease HII